MFKLLQLLLLTSVLFLPLLASADELDKVYDELDAALMSGMIKHPGFDQAYKILSPLADKGDIKAMYHISHLYHLGVGGAKRDAEKAKQLIFTAAEKGYAVAQQQLGYQYERGVYGHIDNKTAVEWYVKAVGTGSCAAVKRLLKAYDLGELGLTKDAEKIIILKQQLKACS